jgi:hypothetical protein
VKSYPYTLHFYFKGKGAISIVTRALRECVNRLAAAGGDVGGNEAGSATIDVAAEEENDPEVVLMRVSVLRSCVFFAGLFSSIFWEQGFDKVCESSRTLKLFEQFDVQFRKWRNLLVPEVILAQNMFDLS